MAIEIVLFPSNMVVFHRFRMFISWHQLGYHHVLKSRSITANMELQALPGSSRYSFTQVVIWKIKQLDTQSRLKKPNQVGSTSDVLIIWYSTRTKSKRVIRSDLIIPINNPIKNPMILPSHEESHEESLCWISRETGRIILHQAYQLDIAWFLQSLPELQMKLSIHSPGHFKDPHGMVPAIQNVSDTKLKKIPQWGFLAS